MPRAAARRSRGRPAPPRQRTDRSYRRGLHAPYGSSSLINRGSAPAATKRRRDTTKPTRGAASHYDRIGFVASPSPAAERARKRLVARYGDVTPEDADVVVALGGDGFMLQTLHRLMSSGKPIYGMHRGTVGFLMNEYQEDGLRERIAAAEPTVIHPLRMRARDMRGIEHESHAINEVSVFRESYQAARL